MHTDELFEITRIAFRYGGMAWEQVETACNEDINDAIGNGEIVGANVDLIRDILVELGELGVDTFDTVEALNIWLDNHGEGV